jgi:hypothetical protein
MYFGSAFGVSTMGVRANRPAGTIQTVPHPLANGKGPRNTTMRYALATLVGILLLFAPLAALPAAGQDALTPGRASFDIRAFGATGDGRTLNTVAIRKAIGE